MTSRQSKPRSPFTSLLSEWRYVEATVAAFIFVPELRRLVDWRGNFDPLNAFAVIPLLMLCPIVILVLRKRSSIRSPQFKMLALVWLGAFTYAMLMAIVHTLFISAAYTFAEFLLPVVVGLWLLTRTEPTEYVYRRFANMLLVFGAIAGAYGIFQYVVAPPWDTTWMQNVEGESFGEPVKFGIRVFGVLNSPGPYALFLGSVILFNLPFLRVRNLFGISATAIMIVGLALSLVRSSWIGLAIGILIFVALTPRRTAPVLSFTLIGVLGVAALGVFLVAFPGSNFSATFGQRISTFSDVGDDPSAADRKQTSLTTLQTAMDQPLGAGLGLTGGSLKLGDSTTRAVNGAPSSPIDNGFVTRFFEMGYPGLAGFLFVGIASVVFAFRAYATYRRSQKPELTNYAAACVAINVVIFLLNASGDGQQGLLGIFFFSSIALALLPLNQNLTSKTHSTALRGRLAQQAVLRPR